MTQQLAIKVYDIDYSFIINNYLDKSLWHKEWTLFNYKNIRFTLHLSKIDVVDEAISFRIHIHAPEYSTWEAVWYYVTQSNIKILKQQIEGTIFRLIEMYEESLIRDEQEYKDIRSMGWEEEDSLREIASNFLDENGVTNNEIREVYIDNYVSNNTRTDTYLNAYKERRKYMVLSDLYLIFTEITKDDTRKGRIISKISSLPTFFDILSELEEYIKQLEENDEEIIDVLKSELEAI